MAFFYPLYSTKSRSERWIKRFAGSIGMRDYVLDSLPNVLLFRYYPETFWSAVRKNMKPFLAPRLSTFIPTMMNFEKVVTVSLKNGFQLSHIVTPLGDEIDLNDYEEDFSDLWEYLENMNVDVTSVRLKHANLDISLKNDGTIEYFGDSSNEVFRLFLVGMSEVVLNE
ncbi:hypothetical protein D0509_00730 [Weissella cibaria]|uniref:hypothetical protein n=1 Tax=Weissella cibaria TaxID=137591 RepID=UPI0021BEC0DD|nr:hypothetical protein [Weissella cibaria]MCT8399161.1 hypothetical protein [Weissella cibaria]MCT8400240.1 hypothetical protein [Weissella cibaria]